MDRDQLYKQFSTGFLLTKCARWVLVDYQQRAHALGLTPIQLGILFCLSQANCTIQQLCHLLVINKTVASRTLKLLREQQLVFATPNTQDARSILYQINQDAWHDIATHLAVTEQQVESKMMQVLNQQEKQQLHALLFAMLTRRDNKNTT